MDRQRTFCEVHRREDRNERPRQMNTKSTETRQKVAPFPSFSKQGLSDNQKQLIMKQGLSDNQNRKQKQGDKKREQQAIRIKTQKETIR